MVFIFEHSSVLPSHLTSLTSYLSNTILSFTAFVWISVCTNSNQKSNYPEMLGQIGLAFGCVNYLTTPSENVTARPSASRQKVHPEDSVTSSKEMLSLPRKASPEDKTPSPNASETIQPKISPLFASECTPTTESKTMTSYGYNAAAKLPFLFSHAKERVCRGGERRSLRSFRPAASVTGRMKRSASSGAAAPHAPTARLLERAHSPGPHDIGSFLLNKPLFPKYY